MRKKILVVLFAMLFIFGITTSAYAAYSDPTNSPSTTSPTNYDPALDLGTGDDSDNWVGNANDTGNDTGNGTTANGGGDALKVIKSDGMTKINGAPETQRTHGAYQNNTNSCASCHQTHTAAGDSLLFKGGVYATCTACHDGTLGFYNVFSNTNMADTLTNRIPSAGTFSPLATASNAGNPSVHLCTGVTTLSAAPGGNRSATTNDRGMWTANFDCAECHAPHGSYSDRLLHYSPNGMGSISIANGGLSVGAVPVVAFSALGGASTPYVLVSGTAAELGITDAGVTNAVALFKSPNAPYSGGGTYTRDMTAFGSATPWLTNSVITGTGSYEVIFGKGYVKLNAGGAVTAGTINRAYVVKLFSTAYPGDQLATFGGSIPIMAVNPSIYDETGYGKAITAYCAACHTDYQSGGAGAAGTGMYSIAFRHNTVIDDVNCLKCHFAHGTNANVMSDAKDNTVASLTAAGATNAFEYMTDKNPSSALKRYTNMSVCWKCHSTGYLTTLLTNNDKFWDAKAAGTAPTANPSGNW